MVTLKGSDASGHVLRVAEVGEVDSCTGVAQFFAVEQRNLLDKVAYVGYSSQNLTKRVAAIADAGVPARMGQMKTWNKIISIFGLNEALRTCSATAHSVSSFRKHLHENVSRKTHLVTIPIYTLLRTQLSSLAWALAK